MGKHRSNRPFDELDTEAAELVRLYGRKARQLSVDRQTAAIRAKREADVLKQEQILRSVEEMFRV